MAELDPDEEAIVLEGGITLEQFPPLESQFNMVVNDFLPYDRAGVGEHVLSPIISDSISELVVHADANHVLELEAAADGTVSTAGVQSYDLPIDVETLGEVEIVGDGQSTLSVKLTTATDVQIVGDGAQSLVITQAAHGRNTTYIVGNILNIPVWPFEPNWANPLVETLTWQTDILSSPTGAEQRRSIRATPRRELEFDLVAARDERPLMDNFLTSYGARRMYVPEWHDLTMVTGLALAGTQFIPSTEGFAAEFEANSIAFLTGPETDPFAYEMIEISTVDETGIQTSTPLENNWPRGSRLYPASAARIVEQPRFQRRNDSVVESDIRFQVLDPFDATGIQTSLSDLYRGFHVMPHEPEESKPLESEFVRMMEEYDNGFTPPEFRDTAGRPFYIQKHTWMNKGRSQSTNFRDMMVAMRGRAIPIWLPTFMNDFKPDAPIAEGSSVFTAERNGFTACGGPRWDRQDIMIETVSGRHYRRIVNSAATGEGGEVIAVDTPLPAIGLREIVRVCFIVLSRLNEDVVEIEHFTDLTGISRVSSNFRSAPDIRVAASTI